MVQKKMPGVMAFYNGLGFVMAWKQAMQYAGKGGRIATLPEIIQARLVTKPGSIPWERYFATLSAEYIGRSAAGNPIAIVAHGVGPMSTLDGILGAYGYEFKDKGRDRRGGRISIEDFRALESGKFGDVHVVDLAATWARREYAFGGHAVTAKEIYAEPLWQVRLGPQWEEFVRLHEVFSREWEEERTGGKVNHAPCILSMDDASNSGYSIPEMFTARLEQAPNTAIAHLLTICGLSHSSHEYWGEKYTPRERRTSLASEVHCHEWTNNTRLAAIRPGTSITDIHGGIDSMEKLLVNHWKKFMRGVGANVPFGFGPLERLGENWFTQYLKKGDGMDTGTPEFYVESIERIPGPKTFTTTIGGYHGFFKYALSEVKSIAPIGANAYYFPGDPQFGGKGHITEVEFYRVKVDTSRRLMKPDEIYGSIEAFEKAIRLCAE